MIGDLTGATNFGHFLGLHGIRTLMPLAILWLAAIVAAVYCRRPSRS